MDVLEPNNPIIIESDLTKTHMKKIISLCHAVLIAVALLLLSPSAMALTVRTPMTGLWWNASESGWGMSLTQQGSTVFAAWYTYDQSGAPSWLVMSNCAVVGSGCSGDIYSVSGGSAPGVAWNGAGKVVTKVGSGTLAFTDDDSGTFSYTLNGVSGTKNIARQIFATGSTQPAQDYTALWWNANESGWGVTLTQQYGMIFVVMYAYDAAGKPVWYVASSCPLSGTTCSGDLYRVDGGSAPTAAWNGGNKATTKVGSISFAFADGNNATMNYVINGVSASKAITRQIFAATGTGGDSSFARLQSKMFAPNCQICHTAGSSFAVQSGLVLDAAVAYKNLVNAPVRDAGAAADGLKLVMPGSADKSLLYQKLLQWNPNLAKHYGSPMPLGGSSPSVGQIEFVKRWINAGAPETGEVADAALLDDQTAPNYQAFVPPAVPAQGLQLTTGAFQVQPKFERELFVYRPLNNPAPLYITRIETSMRANSHHFLLYTYSTRTPTGAYPAYNQVRDIRNPDSTLNFANMQPMAYQVFFGGSMTPTGGYTFPSGVALRVPANAALDLNAHYVNGGTTEITGEAFANLYTVDASQVQHAATTLELNNTDLFLPPNKRSSVTKTFTFGAATRIIMLTSHMHKHGERFVIRIKGGTRDGEQVYENTDWEDPKILTYDQPIVLQAGEGLTSEITYNNTSDQYVTFGLTSEDEMGIVFGYAY